MASQLYSNISIEWTSRSFATKFYQLLSVFYLILLVQLCRAESSNELFNNPDNNLLNTDSISDNSIKIDNEPESNKEEVKSGFRPSVNSYSKIPLKIIYRMLIDQSNFDPMERPRKYDPSDRSYLRFGKSEPQSLLLKQFFSNYMKRPAKDSSFIRFGKRSVN